MGMVSQAFKCITALRMICNHTDLHTVREELRAEGEPTAQSFRSNNPVRLEASGKLTVLDKLLSEWREKGHKVLIFTQSRMMLDIIENLVDQRAMTYIRMDGTTPARMRSVLIDRFNTSPEIFVALLTTRVGGLGVNLTGADRVVIYDPDWNPVVDEQARERAWRIGQTREVCIYRMIVSGTVEEHVLHRQLAKTFVTDKVLKDPTLHRFFSTFTLAQAFMLGHEYSTRLPSDVAKRLINNAAAVKSEVDDEVAREDLVDNTGTAAAAPPAELAAETQMLNNLVDGINIADVYGDTMTQRLASMAAVRMLNRVRTDSQREGN